MSQALALAAVEQALSGLAFVAEPSPPARVNDPIVIELLDQQQLPRSQKDYWAQTQVRAEVQFKDVRDDRALNARVDDVKMRVQAINTNGVEAVPFSTSVTWVPTERGIRSAEILTTLRWRERRGN